MKVKITPTGESAQVMEFNVHATSTAEDPTYSR